MQTRTFFERTAAETILSSCFAFQVKLKSFGVRFHRRATALRHGRNRKYDSLSQRRTCSFVPERIRGLTSVIARLDSGSMADCIEWRRALLVANARTSFLPELNLSWTVGAGGWQSRTRWSSLWSNLRTSLRS